MTVQKEAVFNSIRVESLSARIVSQVLDALFTKQLKAGQFLGTEAQLSEMFQTSRMPVREALSRLEALGVLTIKTGAGGGAIIAHGEPDQFAAALAVQFALIEATAEEIFDARIAIETRAAELAAQNAPSQDIKSLHDLLERMKDQNASGRSAVEVILNFHMAIVEASGSRTLKALMHGLEQPLVSLYMQTSAQLAGKRTRYSGLAQILARIEDGDAKGARDVMHDHLVAQRQWIVKELKAVSAGASA